MPGDIDRVARVLLEQYHALLEARRTDTPPLPGERRDEWEARRAAILRDRALKTASAQPDQAAPPRPKRAHEFTEEELRRRPRYRPGRRRPRPEA
jgi:hypothetical protein